MCKNIRNVCIIAHVDHGKTTMADYLLASNNILSNKSAGSIRYLDSREDEQYRLITMKSSAVALNFRYEKDIKLVADNGDYLINLIDSPGHVDFTYEVISSLRISDGALLLVDVAEGIGDQTRKVLQHAFKERLKIILVLNKMDRLILELGFDVKEAYVHITKLIEQINVVVHQLIQEEFHELMLEDIQIDEKSQDEREKSLEFSFSNGNIVFTSCLHGWCLDIAGGDILKSISARLEVPWSSKTRNNLYNAICSNFYYNSKTRKVTSTGLKKDQPTMMEQFILEPIWNIYRNIFMEFSQEKIRKILQVLCLHSTDVESHISEYLKVQHDSNNPKSTNLLTLICRNIMTSWLPLSKAVFERVINYVPDPNTSNSLRFPSIYSELSTVKCYKELDDLSIVFISKFSACDLVNKRLTKDRLKGNEELNGFVGISRVFWGEIKTGDVLYVSNHHNSRVAVVSLFYLLGSDLIPVERVKNGHIFAVCIREIDDESREQHTDGIIGRISSLDRTLTLSTYPNFPAFNSLYKSDTNSSLSSIIKVSIEPKNIQDLPLMLRGLELLSRSDPCIEIDTSDTGEYILGCHGEVHLERCISDLQFVFAQVPLFVSKPLIAIREGLVDQVSSGQVHQSFCPHIPFPPWSGNTSLQSKEETGQDDEHCQSAEKEQDESVAKIQCELASIKIRAVPMSNDLIDYIEKNQLLVLEAVSPSNINSELVGSRDRLDEINREIVGYLSLHSDHSNPPSAEKQDFSLVGICVKKGSITVLTSNDKNLLALKWSLRHTYDSSYYLETSIPHHKEITDLYRKAINGIITGYEMASTSGPLCEEPIRGVNFVLNELVLEGLSVEEQAVDAEASSPDLDSGLTDIQKSISLISNQLTSTAKELCRRSFLQRGNVRIYEIYLSLVIYCEQSVLGKVYSVINKRRGNVFNEELKEGTSTFKIEAYIPIIESLGISQELRSRASGNISFNMSFSHWELLDEDPFPESSMTMEEFEDEGFSKISLLISNSNRYDYSLQLGFDRDAAGITDTGSNMLGKASMGLGPSNEDDSSNNKGGSNCYGNNTNVARMIINSIRQRKGLPTQHKIVMAAEKQRTLNKKK
ncbi:elongation factor-like protein [Cryptosporidium canis]|uniref:Elongation factor-like protein n=1 Tax=Cryptosporidium canis TaxID=195482 RepID=A0ABQ8P636_9CRYT|nr:elongation factor-like protein [Cryptosporidium canis]KAJ1609643.1 elongation factor-like protein [Cryptosporidium canis]